MKDKIENWKKELTALGEKEKALRLQIDEIKQRQADADTVLLECFMEEYRALPRQVRMKIRHAINTEVANK